MGKGEGDTWFSTQCVAFYDREEATMYQYDRAQVPSQGTIIDQQSQKMIAG